MRHGSHFVEELTNRNETPVGKMVPGVTQTFDVVGSGCGVPADAEAVFINLVAAFPDGPGNLKISAAGTVPGGGVLNYAAIGMNNSNAVVSELSGGQVDVVAVVSPVHSLGVVLGYFTTAPA